MCLKVTLMYSTLSFHLGVPVLDYTCNVYSRSTVINSLYLHERIVHLSKSLHGNELVNALRKKDLESAGVECTMQGFIQRGKGGWNFPPPPSPSPDTILKLSKFSYLHVTECVIKIFGNFVSYSVRSNLKGI